MEDKLRSLVSGKCSTWESVQALEEALSAAAAYQRLHPMLADGRAQLQRMVRQVEVS